MQELIILPQAWSLNELRSLRRSRVVPYSDYERFLPQNEDAVRQRQLQEVDMYDVLIPSIAEPYQTRLIELGKFLDKQIPRNIEGSFDVRKRFLDTSSNLIEGPTNFSQNPYNWYDPSSTLESSTPRTKLPERDPRYIEPLAGGTVTGDEPNKIFISPYTQLLSSSSLLAHEAAHTSQLGKGSRLPWTPLFTPKFYDELLKVGEDRKSPYFWKRGFGVDPYETMSYFMGREAELPAGKTLKDDPSTAPIFAKFPGMYEEYTRSRDKIKSVYKQR